MFYILACVFIVLVFISPPFLCIVSFHCMFSVFLVVLVKLSLLAKLLARKTPLEQ